MRNPLFHQSTKYHMVVSKLQAPVYDILPSTAAVFSYVVGPRKLSANEQCFVGAQTVVSLLHIYDWCWPYPHRYDRCWPYPHRYYRCWPYPHRYYRCWPYPHRYDRCWSYPHRYDWCWPSTQTRLVLAIHAGTIRFVLAVHTDSVGVGHFHLYDWCWPSTQIQLLLAISTCTIGVGRPHRCDCAGHPLRYVRHDWCMCTGTVVAGTPHR